MPARLSASSTKGIPATAVPTSATTPAITPTRMPIPSLDGSSELSVPNCAEARASPVDLCLDYPGILAISEVQHEINVAALKYLTFLIAQ